MLRTLLAVACLSILTACAHAAPAARSSGAGADDPHLARARAVLDRSILFDGHNDLPIAIRPLLGGPHGDLAQVDLRERTRLQTDIPRLREGRVGAQFWSVYIPGEIRTGFARMQLEQIGLMRRIIETYPEDFELVGTADEVVAARRRGRIASMLGMEGGYGIENSLALLRVYRDLGVRYMALTHNTHTDWADSALELPARHGGITDFGREVIAEMNRLGMLIDLSHASDQTASQAMQASLAPVIFSHSNARAICPVPRNVPDELLVELRRNGGVIMVNFVAGFVSAEVARLQAPAQLEASLRARDAKTSEERIAIFREVMGALQLPPVTVGQVADHIEHIRRVAGIDHVGIGADYGGASGWPVGLEDVSTYPNLFAELARRGWTDEELAKLAGDNVLRVLREAEAVAARLQRGD